MRWLAVLSSFVAAGVSLAQTPPFRPDITFVIREHSTGADLVSITLLSPNYSAETLQAQITKLGTLLNSQPRGLQIYRYQLDPDKPQLTFLKASFATDGIIDRDKQIYRIGPILKAFSGAPKVQELHGFSILLEGEQPTAKTIMRYESPAISAEANSQREPKAIEYRITLKSQDESAIDFPDEIVKQAPTPVVPKRTEGTPPWAWLSLAVAALAAGALVYLALLRGRRPAS